ncbi:MAG: PAS domain S-box protein [Minwuia sp.]|uniref:sensor domain-containing diguanylate cyclase n=1 Tax=Minwuia sp. TaxID=2493630 RepID=UPI003A86F64C
MRFSVGTAIDVTAEREGQQRSEWFRQMLDQAEEAVIMVEPDGLISHANKAAAELYGYSVEQLVGMSNRSFIPPEEWDKMEQFSELLRETMRPQTIQTRRLRADGSKVPVHLKVSPLRNPSGSMMGLVGVSFDISDRIELERRERAAAERADMLASIVENLPDPVFHLLPDGVVAYTNSAVRELYGFAPDEIIGQPMSIVRPADRVKAMAEFLGRVRNTGEAGVIETKALHKKGHRIDVEIRAVRFTDKSGQDRGIVGLARDIAERKRLEEELRRRADTDQLTGLFNRHAMDRSAQAEFRRWRRYGNEVSVVVCDLDHFKLVNDEHGHAGGDIALQRFAEILGSSLRRPTDIAARMGGEEFCLILPETDINGAVEVAERIRRRTAEVMIDTGERAFGITVSLGVSKLLPDDVAFEDAMNRADDALYDAKSRGRNRVCVHPLGRTGPVAVPGP